MYQTNIDRLMNELIFQELMFGLAGVVITFLLLYWVIRLGVRHGIKDAADSIQAHRDRMENKQLRDGLS